MKLNYKAVSKDGKIQQGIIEAKDISEAAYYIRGKDLLPIFIKPKQEEISLLSFLKRQGNTDLVLFTRQLSSILASGLTLMQALSILKDQMQNPSMKEIVISVIADVQEGKPLSFGISKFPNVFSPVYISLIKAGESSGFLDKILNRLADNLEKGQKLKGAVKAALIYPAVIVVLMIAVTMVMMIFVIPQLTGLYANLNIKLPFATVVVITISHFFVNWWPIAIGMVALIIFLYTRWVATESGRLIRDEIMLRIPIMGNIVTLSILSEVARTMGLLIEAGSLVVQSLNETSDVAGNLVYRNAILDVAARVEKGIGVGDGMSTYSVFPPIFIQMVKIGEQTGKLDESLLKISEYFEREVEEKVKNLTVLIEPIIMVMLGLGVAFLIISVITPIYNLTSSIQ